MAGYVNDLNDYFGIVPVGLICSPNLSPNAVRLGAYLASKPTGWDCENWKIKKDIHIKSDHSLAKYWKELVNDGWVERRRKRDEDGNYAGGFNVAFKKNNRKTKDEIGESTKFANLQSSPIGKVYQSAKNAITTHSISTLHNSSTNHKSVPTAKAVAPTVKKNKRFVPPTLKEAADYFLEKNGTAEQAERFYNYYESINWYRGRTKIKKWKMAASNWINGDSIKRASQGSKKEKNDEISTIEYD